MSDAHTLLVATHNAGKLREIRDLLHDSGWNALSAAEKNLPEPEETGTTFYENAALKAIASAEASGLPSLADDSGLVVPALDGAPGIYSARWAGPTRDFPSAFARIEKELAERKVGDMFPPAHFTCVLCLALPASEPVFFEGRVDGVLTFPARGLKGFGYDPIFIPDGYQETFGEMDIAEKQRLSHRARAFGKFRSYLRERTFA